MGTAYLIGAVLTYLLTLVDVGLGRYTNTFGFLLRSGVSVHLLGIFYASLSALLILFFEGLVAPALSQANEGQADFLGFLAELKSSPIWLGIFVGIFGRGFADLQLFNVPTPGGAFPVGIKSLTVLFEAPLLKRVLIEHHNVTKKFAVGAVSSSSHSTLPAFQQAFIAAIPPDYPDKVPAGAEFKKTQDTTDIVLKGLRRFGKTWTLQALR